MFSNQTLIIPLLVWFISQTIKFVIGVLRLKVDFSLFVTSSGMPSSHTALVTSLACVVGIKEGFTSSAFAIAVIFAAIVIYDAAGVRYAVGDQAKTINNLIKKLFEGKDHHFKKLKEGLGHRPIEVLVGAILGVGLSVILMQLI
jgi:acid phosphatase family membrane protein YuiD